MSPPKHTVATRASLPPKDATHFPTTPTALKSPSDQTAAASGIEQMHHIGPPTIAIIEPHLDSKITTPIIDIWPGAWTKPVLCQRCRRWLRQAMSGGREVRPSSQHGILPAKVIMSRINHLPIFSITLHTGHCSLMLTHSH